MHVSLGEELDLEWTPSTDQMMPTSFRTEGNEFVEFLFTQLIKHNPLPI